MSQVTTQLTLLQAILIGLYAWFKGCRFGYTFGVLTIFSPLPAALWVGIVLHNIPVAMMVGASLQLMYMGILAPGGALPQDAGIAALFCCTLAVKANLPVSASVALAIPIGLLGVQLFNLERIINAAWVHMADKYAETGNTRGIYLAGILYPTLMKLILYVVPVAAGLYGGALYSRQLVAAIPTWLMNGLSVAGGMMPALGFAIVISVIGRKNLLPYFLLGFMLVEYAKIPILPLAVFGAIIAYLHIVFTNKNNGGVNPNEQPAE